MIRRFGRPILQAWRALRLASLGKTPRCRRVGGGFRMWLDPADFMDRAFYLGLYELHVVRLLADLVAPGDVCVDVGAHKGYLSLHLAKAVGASGRVIAVEPDARALVELRRHLELNRVGNVEVCPCALAESRGTCRFVLSRQLGWSSRFPNAMARPAALGSVVVETRSLDEVLDEAGVFGGAARVSVIKVDAEGSEPLVLEGARQTLALHRPAVLLEVNPGALMAAGFSAGEITGPLISGGYRLYRVLSVRSGRLRMTYSLREIEELRLDDTDPLEEVLALHPAASRYLRVRGYEAQEKSARSARWPLGHTSGSRGSRRRDGLPGGGARSHRVTLLGAKDASPVRIHMHALLPECCPLSSTAGD